MGRRSALGALVIGTALLGPKAGEGGGRIVFEGPPGALVRVATATGLVLALEVERVRWAGKGTTETRQVVDAGTAKASPRGAAGKAPRARRGKAKER